MFAITGIGDWSWLAGVSAIIAAWRRGPMTPEEELRALVLREQHPIRWAVRYPAKAVERLFR